MTRDDITLITGELGPLIKTYVEQVTAPILARNQALEMRLLELETRPVPQGPAGEAGPRGADAIPVDTDYVVRQVLSLMPAPVNGRDGKDAQPVNEDAIVAAVLKALPAPAKGDRGDVGPAGQDAPAIDVDAMVIRAAALVPTPKDGHSGKDGAPGINGQDGAPGVHGKDGAPGIGVVDALIDRSGALVVTLSDGTTKSLGAIIGTDGAPGVNGRDVDMTQVKAQIAAELAAWPRPKDGVDGLGFDDFDLQFDQTRGWVLSLSQGTRVKEWVLPIPFDADVWNAGTTYPKGAGCTWDGHWWIARTSTSDQPGEGSTSWRLAVRRGKQGKAGKDGKDAPALRTTNTPPLYG